MNHLFTPSLDVDFLFKIADFDGDGKIGMDDAQQFFQYTHLPQNTLAIIWTLSVPPKKPMEIPQFVTALKYVSFAQKGIQVDKTLLTNSTPPYPSPNIQCPFLLNSSKINQTLQSFNQFVTPDNPKVSKNQLFEIVIQLNGVINIDELMKLSDIDRDSQLNIIEFFIAMACLNHYILFKKLPIKIPVYFISFLKKKFGATENDIFKSSHPLPSRPKSLSRSVPTLYLERKQSPIIEISSPKSIQKTTPNDKIKQQQYMLHPIPSTGTMSYDNLITPELRHRGSLPIKVQSIALPITSTTISSQTKSLKKKKLSSSNSEVFTSDTIQETVKPSSSNRYSMAFLKSPITSPQNLQRKSFQYSVSPSLSPHNNEPLLKSDLIYQSCSVSPYLSDEELTPYQKSRRHSILNIDDNTSFPSFSFSYDSSLSIDSTLQSFDIKMKPHRLLDLDSIISSLSTQKAELLAEITELQQEIDKLTTVLESTEVLVQENSSQPTEELEGY
ncbi:EF hand domain containing protein [Entamoeba histolytica HM-3:IMSS]|uniref:EF-hand domain-containing protein n=5 Tax=Entamoeba histolytica TaxID=5759 RepID=C4M720_ENTH1|nr:hypothetical protein, conserved [Entamoeba histolytica HM-1:IMSS]EAL46936.2 hypothetical protein, conserved [Entamoeba histolytica HM-1:IMSS]EMS17718.1 EF hand domain containing protein [Entamoeba histolytica HM-3:IMSS]ENY65766.1 EF hand domain containing protein [Entamoeba histolytica HM-1:IMSS-A]GAT97298.1 hypothetical protein conserved [Entamoeba histolytica]|eukprot:XP_652322.2 hypothetical protein, conserved [Entamoeba histolytica HM-1:IMSS]